MFGQSSLLLTYIFLYSLLHEHEEAMLFASSFFLLSRECSTTKTKQNASCLVLSFAIVPSSGESSEF